ncbi:uncharacterized protein [Maniola hyperantus]|uniref:uncharacterized protein n=1 Tax=Aphantopus hyperantus TaxID=2795564 RepID=UPI003749FC01
MFDTCLVFLFIFGSHDALVAGQGQYYAHFANTTITSLPTSTLMASKILGNYDSLSCDFNGNDVCGWTNDSSATGTWTKYSNLINSKGLEVVMPKQSFRLRNRTARLISPLYSSELDKNGCFLFRYNMYYYTSVMLFQRSVGIRVYQKPEYVALEDLIELSDEAKKEYILFEKWGEQVWWSMYEEKLRLKHFDANFQIIIEGIFVDLLRRITVVYVDILPCTANTTATTTTVSPPTKDRPRGVSDYLRCDFNYGDWCGWTNDPTAIGSWAGGTHRDLKRLVVTMPKQLTSESRNRTARLISPLYSRELERNGCFHFCYQMWSIGLQVYQKPEKLSLKDLVEYSDEAKKDYILFEIWGDFLIQEWYCKKFALKHFNENFQIIIEGIFMEGDRRVAIDAVEISQGSECPATTTAAPTTSTATTTSTTTFPGLATTTSPLPTTTSFPQPTTTTFPQPTTTFPRPTSTQRQRGSTVGRPGQYAGNPSSRSVTTELGIPDDEESLFCTFEPHVGTCGWENDPRANHSWFVNQLHDPSTNEDQASAFIYFNKPSQQGNGSVRLISPHYSRLFDNNGCFVIIFKMFSMSQSRPVGIRVYQKPDYIALEDLLVSSDEVKKNYVLFEARGAEWGNNWYNKESTLTHFDYNFQIIIEGIFGEDPVYMAIAFVAMQQSNSCSGLNEPLVPVRHNTTLRRT